jgi:hypothetical protein
MFEQHPPNSVSSACRFCIQRALDAAALRREDRRGKQLGRWEREILRRSGPSRARLPTRGERERLGGLPLLREVFPERNLDRDDWEIVGSPSQPVLRAAGARLEHAGLISLLAPTAGEAGLWIEQAIGRDWEEAPAVRRRLLLGSSSWRTLLGDEIVTAYAPVFGRAGSTLRIRWDGRLDEALALADSRCREGHDEDVIVSWSAALRNAKRPNVLVRR